MQTAVELIPIDRTGRPARAAGEMPDMIRQNCEATASYYDVIGFEPPWIGYLTLFNGQAVGGCAFKGRPQRGRVEIAYYTLPAFEGHGLATAAARQLVQIARDAQPGIVVFAQTLPESNASNTLLRRLGFAFSGSVMHADDGEVWEWVLDAAAAPG